MLGLISMPLDVSGELRKHQVDWGSGMVRVKSRWVGARVCTLPVKAFPSGSLLGHNDEV